MKNRKFTKKGSLDSFTRFKVANLKSIFGGTVVNPIEKKKLKRPGNG